MRFILFPNKRRRRHPQLPKHHARKIKPVADAHPDWSDEEVAREAKIHHSYVGYYRNPPKRRDVPRRPFIMQREGQPTPWIFRKPFSRIYDAHCALKKVIAKITRRRYLPPWYTGVFPPRGVDAEERDRQETWAIAEWFGQMHESPDVKKLFKERIRQKVLNDPDRSGTHKQQLLDEGPRVTPEEEWRALRIMSAWDVPADHIPPWVTEKVLAFREAEPVVWLERMLEVEKVLAEIEPKKHELSPGVLEAQEREMASLAKLLPLARQAASKTKQNNPNNAGRDDQRRP